MALLELKKVSKSFGTSRQRTPVLDSIDGVFPSRGLVLIHGSSGSGKSTLLNLLCGLDTPTSGTIFFDGKALEKQSPKQRAEIRRCHMGRVFQHYELLNDLDALTNVMMPLLLKGETSAVARQRGEELLRTYGLEESASKKVAKLSGGEKQRLAVIRAIIHRPEILLADEPTGALDHSNAQIVADMLLDYSHQALVIVVTHDLQLFKEVATSVFCLRDRKLTVEKLNESVMDIPSSSPFVPTVRKRTSWSSLLAKTYFVQRKKIHTISLLSSGIAWAACLLTVGFAFGSGPSIVDASKQFFDFETASVSKVSKTPVEGSPLTLMQSSRPSVSEMSQFSQRFDSMRFDVDLNPLFSSIQGKVGQREITGFSFCPIRNFSFSSRQQNMLVKGTLPTHDDFETLIINREMEHKLLEEEPSLDIFDMPFLMTSQATFELTHPENPFSSVRETFSFSQPMRIVAVVKETSFLNEPRLFYSHHAASDFLEAIEAPLFSAIVHQPVNWFQLLKDASGNDALSSYRYLIFIQNEANIEAIFLLAQKQGNGSKNFEISSHAFTHREALASIGYVLRIALLFFVLVSLLGSLFILGISGYSSFISKLKESAILLSMGATFKEICSIFMNESLFVGLFSAILAIVLSLPCQSLFNFCFEKYLGISHPISIPFSSFLGFPLLLVFLVLLFSMGLSVLATGIPVAFFHQSNLVANLRDE